MEPLQIQPMKVQNFEQSWSYVLHFILLGPDSLLTKKEELFEKYVIGILLLSTAKICIILKDKKINYIVCLHRKLFRNTSLTLLTGRETNTQNLSSSSIKQAGMIVSMSSKTTATG